MKPRDLNAQEKENQKILNQLISEEWLASIMYKQFILAACCKEERHQIKDLLLEISEDEMDDHYDKLVKYAIHNGYYVPCQMKDYEKFASDKTVKQFNGWKKDQDAGYYIQQSIDAEIEAIHSYESVMSKDGVPYDILEMLVPNYYDEQEHLQKLMSLNIIYKTGGQYIY